MRRVVESWSSARRGRCFYEFVLLRRLYSSIISSVLGVLSWKSGDPLFRRMTPTCHSFNPLSALHKPCTATAYAAALSPGRAIPRKWPIVIPTGQALFPGDAGSELTMDVGVWRCEIMDDLDV